jgi:NAD(P)-dependent dehydrogenase (short-subunit alcohol dehydrogenase family)
LEKPLDAGDFHPARELFFPFAVKRDQLALGVTVAEFGKNMPMKRPGHPAELANAYVMPADPTSGYVSGASIATGGKLLL